MLEIFKNMVTWETRFPAFPGFVVAVDLWLSWSNSGKSVFFAVWVFAVCAWLASGQHMTDRGLCTLVHFLYAPSVKFYPGFPLLFKQRLRVSHR